MCEFCRAVTITTEKAEGTEHEYIIPYVEQRFHAENSLLIRSLTPWDLNIKDERPVNTFKRNEGLDLHVDNCHSCQSTLRTLEESLDLEYNAMTEYLEWDQKFTVIENLVTVLNIISSRRIQD